MQFLFVVLMSVLVGASALPHVLQAPNRPSFSLRKNTSFSLVAIPKFFQKVANIDEKIAAIEAEQIRKKQAAQAPSEVAANEAATNDSDEPAAREPAAVPTVLSIVPEGTVVPPPVKKTGLIDVKEVDLQACICNEAHIMTCDIWIKGKCSEIDQFIDVDAKTDDRDFKKSFRCKEDHFFSGTVPVHGGGAGNITFNYMDKEVAKTLNMINHCGKIGYDFPQSDE
jgi:hypothetical protein